MEKAWEEINRSRVEAPDTQFNNIFSYTIQASTIAQRVPHLQNALQMALTLQ